jgi:hypothetical protein
MTKRILRLAGIGTVGILLMWVLFVYIHTLYLYRHAKEVPEPLYTLVVNGKIIQHPYAVHFDRYDFDVNGQWIGYDDGQIEIPLLTVFNAMGAGISENKTGEFIIEYSGKEYIFLPSKQAIYPLDTNGILLTEPSDNHLQWDESNLLLLWPEKEGYIFREDHGEYIVDLGSLQKLKFYMNFTFDFDLDRGIVYFDSH